MGDSLRSRGDLELLVFDDKVGSAGGVSGWIVVVAAVVVVVVVAISAAVDCCSWRIVVTLT
jgi:hypothetical protein